MNPHTYTLLYINGNKTINKYIRRIPFSELIKKVSAYQHAAECSLSDYTKINFYGNTGI